MKRIAYLIMFLALSISGHAQLSVDASDTVACDGADISITASGMEIYSWSSTTVLDTNAGDSVNISPAVGTYMITATGYDTTVPDTQMVVVTVTINPNPTVVIQSSASGDNDFVCLGNSATLNAISDTAVLASVVWSPSTYLNTSSGTEVISTPDSLVTYTATVTNDYGCSTSGTRVVKVGNNYPAFSVSLTPEIICPGDSSELMATPTTVVSKFEWSPSTTLSSNSGSIVYASPTTTTTYDVVGTRDGCSVDTTVTLNVLTPPNMTYTQSSGGATIKLDETDVITVMCTECVSYIWKLPNSTLFTSQNVQSISPNTPGANEVKITGLDSNSCKANVNVTVNVDSSFAGTPFGLNDLAVGEVVVVQKGDAINITSGSNIQQVSLYNLLGEEVIRKVNGSSSQEEIATIELSSGVYIITVRTDNDETVEKIYLN